MLSWALGMLMTSLVPGHEDEAAGGRRGEPSGMHFSAETHGGAVRGLPSPALL